jgi:hypothetical protein
MNSEIIQKIVLAGWGTPRANFMTDTILLKIFEMICVSTSVVSVFDLENSGNALQTFFSIVLV